MSVGLGAAINSTLPYLQAQAESRMTDTVSIVRLGPAGRPDAVTGKVTTPETVIYTGIGRVKPLPRVTAGSVTAGEGHDSQSVYIVSVPHSAVGLKAGDVVRPTASADPEILTDVLRVVNIEDAEQTTARRLTCELVERRQP